MRTDLENSGGDRVDESVVDDSDGGTPLTSRDPDDFDDFVGVLDDALAVVPA